MSDTDLSVLETETFAHLDAALQTQAAQDAQVMQQLQQQLANWQPTPAAQYLANAARLQQWLAYYGYFDRFADQLGTGGRPAFAQRLKAVKDDLAGAIKIYTDMATQAGANAVQLQNIVAQSQLDTTQAILDMNAARQRAYDASNEAWMRNFQNS